MENLRKILDSRQPLLYNMRGCLISAVLLPLLKVEGSLHVLFEVRARHLKRQPGEVCFPGGMVEPDELGRPQDAAIRETCEELGVLKENIELIGPLDYFISPIGAIIYPFLGEISVSELPLPNPDEVEEIFLVPLSHILTVQPDQSSIDIGTRFADDFPFDRLPRYYQPGWRVLGKSPIYFYEYGNRLIWGATAGILHSFIDVYRENASMK